MRVLRILCPIYLALMLCVPTRCQQTADPEEAIRRIIYSGLLEGHDQKVIGGTGDAAAVTITKVVGGRSLNPAQIDRVLLVLNMAFGGVATAPDAEPKTTLFVLRQLDLSTSDAQLKERIAKVREFVQEEFLKANVMNPSKLDMWGLGKLNSSPG